MKGLSQALMRKCLFQDLDLSLIVTENGSLLLCCWRHNMNMSIYDIDEELTRYHSCITFLTQIESHQYHGCKSVQYLLLIREDLPFPDSATKNPKCPNKSVDVRLIQNRVTCLWIPGQFDMGVEPFHDMGSLRLGLMHPRICKQLHHDCQVTLVQHFTTLCKCSIQ